MLKAHLRYSATHSIPFRFLGSLSLNLVFICAAFAQGASADAEIDSAGLSVYRSNYCGVCHTLAKAETHGVFGPTHDGLRMAIEVRINDPNYTGSATTAEEYLRESILNPQVYLVPGFGGGRYAMPPYTNLTEIEVEALVRFLLEPTAVDTSAAKPDPPDDRAKLP